jgi:hypothetical protein
MHGEKRTLYSILVRKPEGMRPIGRPRSMWQCNINTNLRNIRLGGMEWIELVQDRDQWRALVSTVMNLSSSYKILRNF